MTADGLTVDSIAGKGWTILPEAESDWRSHAAAVAQSVKLIKKRLKVQSFVRYFVLLMFPKRNW
jgi:peptide chain release factor 2